MLNSLHDPHEVGLYLGVTDLADADAFLAFAEEVDRLGYPGVSMPHSIARDFPRVDTLVMLSAAAARTQRVRLNIAAIQVPLYAPVALARMLMSIDRLSKGRLEVAAGVGWVPKEFANLGIPYKERGRRTDETLEIMQRLWSEEEVSYQGRHFTLNEVRLSPKPVQQPIPMLIGGGYHHGMQGAPGEAPRKPWNENSFKRMARYGHGWCTASQMGAGEAISVFQEGMEKVRAAGREIGRVITDDDFSIVPVLGQVLIADSREQAVEEGRKSYAKRTAKAFYQVQSNPEFDTWIANGAFGSPEMVAEWIVPWMKIRKEVPALKQLIVRFCSLDDVTQARRFHEQVMPLIRRELGR